MTRRLAWLVLLLALPAAADDHEVTQKDKSFSQTHLVVRRGDRVTFRNDDSVVHNVFSRSSGNEFEIRAQPPGMAQAVPLASAGRVEVRCAIHPDMKMTIDVKP